MDTGTYIVDKWILILLQGVGQNSRLNKEGLPDVQQQTFSIFFITISSFILCMDIYIDNEFLLNEKQTSRLTYRNLG